MAHPRGPGGSVAPSARRLRGLGRRIHRASFPGHTACACVAADALDLFPRVARASGQRVPRGACALPAHALQRSALDITRLGAAGIYADRAPYRTAVRDAETGVLCGDSPAEWVRNILGLLDDKPRVVAIAQAARLLARADRAANAGWPPRRDPAT